MVRLKGVVRVDTISPTPDQAGYMLVDSQDNLSTE